LELRQKSIEELAMLSSLRSTAGWWMNRCVSRVAFVGFCVAAAAAGAQDLVHVEEDWELVIATPDQNSCGPQVACAMSPFTDISGTYFTIEINHRSAPYWTPGGITLHQWWGDARVQSLDRADRSVMNTPDEVVTWTQSLDVGVASNTLTFQVKNGTSSTWGNFGTSGHLKLQSWFWGGGNLNNYTPDVSVGQSGVAYASNRVRSLKILQIRGTLDDGTTASDNSTRVVYQLQE
jgi:hypothetical protein